MNSKTPIFRCWDAELFRAVQKHCLYFLQSYTLLYRYPLFKDTCTGSGLTIDCLHRIYRISKLFKENDDEVEP